MEVQIMSKLIKIKDEEQRELLITGLNISLVVALLLVPVLVSLDVELLLLVKLWIVLSLARVLC